MDADIPGFDGGIIAPSVNVDAESTPDVEIPSFGGGFGGEIKGPEVDTPSFGGDIGGGLGIGGGIGGGVEVPEVDIITPSVNVDVESTPISAGIIDDEIIAEPQIEQEVESSPFGGFDIEKPSLGGAFGGAFGGEIGGEIPDADTPSIGGSIGGGVKGPEVDIIAPSLNVDVESTPSFPDMTDDIIAQPQIEQEVESSPFGGFDIETPSLSGAFGGEIGGEIKLPDVDVSSSGDDIGGGFGIDGGIKVPDAETPSVGGGIGGDIKGPEVWYCILI